MPLSSKWGIWSVDPYGPNIADTALNTAKDVSDIVGHYYKNKYAPDLAQADLGTKQATMQALGAKATADKAAAGRNNAITRLLTGGGAGLSPSGRVSLGNLGAAANTPPTQTNADGSVTTIESPTPTIGTYAQNRLGSESENDVLYPLAKQGVAYYSGPGGNIRLMKDVWTYKTDPTSQEGMAAHDRLKNYQLAKQFIPEVATINARQASGRDPGIEAIREFENAMFPNMPSGLANYLIPQDILDEAKGAYKPAQQQGVQAFVNQERSGFPQQQNVPAWAQGNLGVNPLGGKGFSSFHQAIANTPKSEKSMDDKIAHTAKKYGISTDEVKKRLGMK